MAVCGVSDVLIVKKGFEIISHKIIDNHYFTLNEHPKVNLAFPPVGLHKRVLHLKKLFQIY